MILPVSIARNGRSLVAALEQLYLSPGDASNKNRAPVCPAVGVRSRVVLTPRLVTGKAHFVGIALVVAGERLDAAGVVAGQALVFLARDVVWYLRSAGGGTIVARTCVT